MSPWKITTRKLIINPRINDDPSTAAAAGHGGNRHRWSISSSRRIGFFTIVRKADDFSSHGSGCWSRRSWSPPSSSRTRSCPTPPGPAPASASTPGNPRGAVFSIRVRLQCEVRRGLHLSQRGIASVFVSRLLAHEIERRLCAPEREPAPQLRSPCTITNPLRGCSQGSANACKHMSARSD